MSVALDPRATICLHADLTALLMAYHLDILETIEGAFGPDRPPALDGYCTRRDA